MPISEALHIDCMKELPNIPGKFFDLANPDPPYYSGPEKRKFYGRNVSVTGIKRVEYHAFEKTWTVPDDNYFNELKRVSKNQIIWGGNYFPQLGEVHKTPRRRELQNWLKTHHTGWIVWDKVNGETSYNDFELAWTSFDRPTVIFPFMWNGMFQGKSISEGTIQNGDKSKCQRRIHPTEKPLPLYKWTYFNYCKIGDKILDTHMGSQISRVAVWEMGLDYWGHETDTFHFTNGSKRFNLISSQQKLEFA